MITGLLSAGLLAASVFIEAEDFDEKGRWEVETQFVHQMNSAYLLAPGVGTPVGSARTKFRAPQSGRYHVWVRTKDWAPEKGPGTGPGRFAVSLNKVRLGPLGVSGKSLWHWEKAGECELKKGDNELELVDLSGWFARCDAVFMSTDASEMPRRPEMATLDGGSYDVIVVGGGSAGVVSGVAAARHGMKTLIVQDRALLGGNASHEFLVPMRGIADNHKIRESGIVEEAILWKSRLDRFGRGMSDAFEAVAAGETNLTVRLNARVIGAETADSRIVAAIAKDVLTGRKIRYTAKMFIDASGDGWLGYYAGADYRCGREGPGESDDDWLPRKADGNMMCGELGGWEDKSDGAGFTRGYKAKDTGRSATFVSPVWAIAPGPEFKPLSWYLTSGPSGHDDSFDALNDPEGARDLMIRQIVGNWGFIKNESEMRKQAEPYSLSYIAWNVSRREGRRLSGDYRLTSKDMLSARIFPDRVAVGGYPISNHSAAPRLVPPIYTIPYRSLYSTNIVNLFMAGRCASVTHRAHGGLRVQCCAAVMGQAVGTAAAGCIRRGLSPREYGRRHIRELQQTLLKDDQWIAGLTNEDPYDLARKADKRAEKDCVTLSWPKPVTAREIRLTFEYDRSEVDPRKPPSGMALCYEIDVLVDGNIWRKVGGEDDNFLRLRSVSFDPVPIRALRVSVRKWRGSPGSIAEVRVY